MTSYLVQLGAVALLYVLLSSRIDKHRRRLRFDLIELRHECRTAIDRLRFEVRSKRERRGK